MVQWMISCERSVAVGYVLLPLTLIVDVLAGYASYYFAASVLPYLWTFLSQFAWPAFLYLITWFVAFWVHRVPAPWPPAFIPYFEHPVWPLLGQIWVGFFLASHLYYAIKHLSRRYDPTHLGVPQVGNPGEDKWELVQRRWHEYALGLDRFYHKVSLLRPMNWRYTNEADVPIVELRGRQLRIREDGLHASQVPYLGPELSCMLGDYNSHDWLFADILDYYPRRMMKWHIILGIGIWIPTLLKVTAWPILHWRKRVMVKDKLAWMCGQGQSLYDKLAVLPSYGRPFFSPYPLRSQRLGQLEALIRTEYRWMKDHHLIDESVEPPILHTPAQGVPQQLHDGRPQSKQGSQLKN
jgi:hypothetical protein